MNCNEAQEAILLSDDPAAIARGEGELARHVAGCAVCGAFVGRLVRMEGAAARLPGPADSEMAKQRTLASMKREARSRWRMVLRPAWISAAAAVLIIGLSVAMWRQQRPTQQVAQAQVVDQLIDWDLALADAEAPAERQDLYAAQAATLASAVQRASLNDEDRQFATTLLENGAWLSRNHDPVERTEKFCDLADLLVGRMGRAAASNDANTVQRLGKHFGRVQRGIGANLERLGANAYVAPGNPARRAERLERIEKRQEEVQRRLAALAEKSPRAAQKALHRMMENPKKAGRRGGVGENVR